MDKACSHCGKLKPSEEFYADKSKACGLSSRCKTCAKFKARLRQKNADKRSRTYIGRPCRKCANTVRLSANGNCVDCTKAADRLRAKAPAKREYYRVWLASNRDKSNAAKKAYRARNIDKPAFKAAQTARSMLWRCLADGRTLSRLPYSVEALMARIECQFKPGMSWANYGDWEIDHKIPIKWFRDKGETRPEVVNALCNLQPLWKSDNRSKGGRREWLQPKLRSLAS